MFQWVIMDRLQQEKKTEPVNKESQERSKGIEKSK